MSKSFFRKMANFFKKMANMIILISCLLFLVVIGRNFIFVIFFPESATREMVPTACTEIGRT